MLRKFNKTELQRIKARYALHPLFMVCEEVALPRIAHFDGFFIEIEEVFYAVANLLDTLYNTQDLTQQKVNKLWNDLYLDVRKMEKNATEHDKLQVAYMVFAIVKKLLCHHWDSRLCDVYYVMLTQTVRNETSEAKQDEMDKVKDTLSNYSTELDEWINQGYDGLLSRQIIECARKKKPETAPATPSRRIRKTPQPKKAFKYSPMNPYREPNAVLQMVFEEMKKMNIISQDSDPKDFIDTFTETIPQNKIGWIATTNELYYFINELLRCELITSPTGHKWLIVTQCFCYFEENDDGTTDIKDFTNKELSKSHNPQDTSNIDYIIRLLDPKTMREAISKLNRG